MRDYIAAAVIASIIVVPAIGVAVCWQYWPKLENLIYLFVGMLK